MSDDTRPRGLSRDTGWIVGVRRTLPLGHEALWELLTSAEGLRAWLGEAPELAAAPDVAYRLADGTSGAFTVVAPYSHLRLTWLPLGWPRPAIIQVRVIPKGHETVVAFHQEHLPDEAARLERRTAFTNALERLRKLCLNARKPGLQHSA